MSKVTSMLKTNVKTDLSGIKSDVKEYVRRVVKEVATDVGNEIDDNFLWAMAKYYSSYTPEIYQRHYYNFMKMSHKKYYQNHLSLFSYTAGTEYTLNNMDEIYTEPVSTLWDFVYKVGSHGRANVITSPSPEDLMLSWRDEIVKNAQKYVDRNLRKVNSSGFSTLQFT